MQRQSWAIYLAVVAMFPVASRAEDMVGKVKKAVERTTLDQNGMAPFHLKAVLAPRSSSTRFRLVWPPVQDGPFQGNVTTILIVDRDGKGRDIESVVSENAAITRREKKLSPECDSNRFW